eukprot:1155502-Pelagomonas_calceolata.AAC.8
MAAAVRSVFGWLQWVCWLCPEDGQGAVMQEGSRTYKLGLSQNINQPGSWVSKVCCTTWGYRTRQVLELSAQ